MKETEVVRSELDRYLEEAVKDEVPHFDILKWWKTNPLLTIYSLTWLVTYWQSQYQLLFQNPFLVRELEFLISFLAP